MSEIVAADIGGTHARFAIARVEGGRVTELGQALTRKTADFASLEAAWAELGGRIEGPLPRAAAIAVAAPVDGEVLKLTNNDWVIHLGRIQAALGVERFLIVNDFGAVAHAVAQFDGDHLRHLCGPDRPLPSEGVISVIGPGTGLGVAQLIRGGGRYRVVETEGGHMDFAPLDSVEDALLLQLRGRHGRVSVERIVSGPGLANIHNALAHIEGRPAEHREERMLWGAALDGGDGLAAVALDRFCLALGAVAGDIALAQGASAVVIAGGLGLRLADRLGSSGFRDRFIAKGRFERRMDEMPVKLIVHPEPGLFGAAAAFAERFSR